MKILGQAFSRASFPGYLDALRWTGWKPQLLVLHHTAAPSLEQRPHGLSRQHLLNIADFYAGKGWSAGPHLFIDDDDIWTFTPLTQRGVHAVSFNRLALGLEMLGDYDREDPWSGRGKEVLTTTAHAVKALLRRLALPTSALRFHRDDPKTTKSCPGKKLRQEDFLRFLATV